MALQRPWGARQSPPRRQTPRPGARADEHVWGGVVTAAVNPPAGRAAPPMDAKGQRYRLPDPKTGKDTLWTRSTTFAKAIANMEAIHKWEKRLVVKGISQRPDLHALAAATPLEDKKKLDELADQAKEFARASAGSNLGTALHAFTEQVDRGEELTAPEPWAADIAAYRDKLAGEQITVIPSLIERVVIVPAYKVAGKFDRIVQMPDGRQLIADVKTTQNIDYSWNEIAIQLALYAHARHMTTEDYRAYLPMPNVNVDQALVMHVPAGQGRCDLYTVDIAAGWEAAYFCKLIRSWRSRRNLHQPYVYDRVLERIGQATSREALEALWAEAAAFGQWTDQHTSAAKQRAAQLEAEGEAAA